MRIVFFGDSLTWGGYGGDFVGEVRKLVGDRHEIINAGKGGNTIINLSRRLEEDVLAHQPDKVFIMVGGNDVVSYSQPDSRMYYRKSMQLSDGYVSPDEFSQTYRDILSELQANHVETYIGLEPMEANRTTAETMHRYNDLAREAARAYNVPILDLYSQLVPDDIPERPNISNRFIVQIGERERTGWNDWYSAQAEGGYAYSFDGVHWTPKVAEDVAERVVEFMELG